MAAIPSLLEEDAKRPSREGKSLVSQRTRIGSRIKSTLARLGIRGFKPGLRKAAERLGELRTPEGTSCCRPHGGRTAPRHGAAALYWRVRSCEIEAVRLERLGGASRTKAGHPMVLLLARVIGIGIETADMLVQEVLSRKLRDRRAVARYGGLTGSPDESGARRRDKGFAKAGKPGCVAACSSLLALSEVPKGQRVAQWYGRAPPIPVAGPARR